MRERHRAGVGPAAGCEPRAEMRWATPLGGGIHYGVLHGCWRPCIQRCTSRRSTVPAASPRHCCAIPADGAPCMPPQHRTRRVTAPLLRIHTGRAMVRCVCRHCCTGAPYLPFPAGPLGSAHPWRGLVALGRADPVSVRGRLPGRPPQLPRPLFLLRPRRSSLRPFRRVQWAETRRG